MSNIICRTLYVEQTHVMRNIGWNICDRRRRYDGMWDMKRDGGMAAAKWTSLLPTPSHILGLGNSHGDKLFLTCVAQSHLEKSARKLLHLRDNRSCIGRSKILPFTFFLKLLSREQLFRCIAVTPRQITHFRCPDRICQNRCRCSRHKTGHTKPIHISPYRQYVARASLVGRQADSSSDSLDNT